MFEATIAAIATPLGEGGLAVIRISGAEALTIADRCFAPAGKAALKPSNAATHTLHYGHLLREGRVIDEVLLAVMRAPKTFTREDVVEISCHGGILASKLVLDAVLAAGARLAEPGEFTRRAFLNGRIDLVQAEAVVDLIHSRTELALRAANEQLAGKLSARIGGVRNELVGFLAHVEAHIDFPEEDIGSETREALVSGLERSLGSLRALLNTASEGRVLRRGVRVAILGRPNAGKSSLLNQLLGHDRAIVSPIPGTTRDTVEETANIRGLPMVLVDTAGLREGGDEIEAEGMRRSRKSFEMADLVVQVFDCSEPLGPADSRFLRDFAGKKRVMVRNKIDLGIRLELPPDLQNRIVDVSCVTGAGIEELKEALKALVWSGEIRMDMLEAMINSRHEEVLDRARTGIVRTLRALKAGETLELVAMDLRIAVNAIGEVVGQTATEDILDVIFSRFCIGK